MVLNEFKEGISKVELGSLRYSIVTHSTFEWKVVPGMDLETQYLNVATEATLGSLYLAFQWILFWIFIAR